MTNENVSRPTNALELEKTLIKCKVSWSALYEVLLHSCVIHDMLEAEKKLHEKNLDTPENDIVGVLFSDTKALLSFFGSKWNLSEPLRAIAYMKELGDEYRDGKISVRVLKESYRNALDYTMGEKKTRLDEDEVCKDIN
jgi:hypothetical protein